MGLVSVMMQNLRSGPWAKMMMLTLLDLRITVKIIQSENMALVKE